MNSDRELDAEPARSQHLHSPTTYLLSNYCVLLYKHELHLWAGKSPCACAPDNLVEGGG